MNPPGVHANSFGRMPPQLPGLADARILLVDDDPGTIQWLCRLLSGYPELRFASSGADALQQAQAWRPELILLDAEMPGMNGFEVFRALRADAELADIPVIFVTQHSEPQIETAVFEMGAADFITKPVAGPALRARVAMHLRLRRLVCALATLDQQNWLTGLANSQRLNEQLALEWARAKRSGQPLSLLLADIDHWRTYTEAQGTSASASDETLRRIARLVQSLTSRAGDLAARYGGDKFALLLPATDAAGATALATRLAIGMQALSLAHPASPIGSRLTLSIGLGTWATPDPSSGRAELHHGVLRQAAASALAEAQAAGRNRTVWRGLAEPLPETLSVVAHPKPPSSTEHHAP